MKRTQTARLLQHLRRPWTPDEVESLALSYPHEPNKVLAEKFQRSTDAVGFKARELGLSKTPECLSRIRLAGWMVNKNLPPAKHGLSVSSRAYRSWLSMRARCLNTKHSSYPAYGGAGITICPQWNDFAVFYKDMGEPAPGLTIDRIEGSKGYYPGNCRWATASQQQRNRTVTRRVVAFGVERLAVEWAELTGVQAPLIRGRLDRGWAPELAVSAKPGERIVRRVNGRGLVEWSVQRLTRAGS